MENIKNKNLAELFNLGIELNKKEKINLLNKIQDFDLNLAQELQLMFDIEPTKQGLSFDKFDVNRSKKHKEKEKLPKSIGKYAIKEILGYGGMGIVYLGEIANINQKVAIKVANSILSQGIRADAITHEAKILASLKHSHIAALVDWGIYGNDRHFMATEYIDGTSISNYCNKNNLNALQRITLFIDVVDAIGYAHNHLVIHRDIKPNNILVEENGNIKLIDFGVARLMETVKGQYQQTIGAALTPSFASPEQLRGESLSVSTDIYSLGAVLFNLLTCENLDKKDSTQRSTLKTIEYKFKHPLNKATKLINLHKVDKQIFNDIVLVVGKALNEDINQRYQTTQAFKHDLNAIINIKPIQARKPSYWYYFKKYVARNKMVAFVIITLVTIALSALVFAMIQWNIALNKNKEIIVSNKNLKSYSKFLNTTFKGLDAYSGGDPNITMEKFMANSVELYKNETNVQPEQLARHAVTLSSIYESWGYYKQANAILELGIKNAQKSITPQDDVSLWTEKALLHSNDLNYVEGEFAAKKALEIINNNPETLWRRPYALLALAAAYRESGQLNKSIKSVQKIIDDPSRKKIEIAFANYAQAKVQLRLYKLDEAFNNLTKALPVYLNRYGENSAQIADTKVLLFLANARKYRKKVSPNEQSKLIKLFEKAYNKDHINNSMVLNILAEAHFLSNNFLQAIKLQKQSIAILNSNSDTPLTDSVTAIIELSRYYQLYGNFIAATEIMASMENTNTETVENHILAKYYLIKSALNIQTHQLQQANTNLEEAFKYLVNSEYVELVAQYHFQKAQLSALNKDWQQCKQSAQNATHLANNLYPKSWELPKIYNYLAKVCNQKMNDNYIKIDTQEIMNSPWKQEVILINKIIFENK